MHSSAAAPGSVILETSPSRLPPAILIQSGWSMVSHPHLPVPHRIYLPSNRRLPTALHWNRQRTISALITFTKSSVFSNAGVPNGRNASRNWDDNVAMFWKKCYGGTFPSQAHFGLHAQIGIGEVQQGVTRGINRTHRRGQFRVCWRSLCPVVVPSMERLCRRRTLLCAIKLE